MTGHRRDPRGTGLQRVEGHRHATTQALDEELATLHRARTCLSGALLCRFDHPATDCKIMGPRSIVGSQRPRVRNEGVNSARFLPAQSAPQYAPPRGGYRCEQIGGPQNGRSSSLESTTQAGCGDDCAAVQKAAPAQSRCRTIGGGTPAGACLLQRPARRAMPTAQKAPHPRVRPAVRHRSPGSRRAGAPGNRSHVG